MFLEGSPTTTFFFKIGFDSFGGRVLTSSVGKLCFLLPGRLTVYGTKVRYLYFHQALKDSTTSELTFIKGEINRLGSVESNCTVAFENPLSPKKDA